MSLSLHPIAVAASTHANEEYFLDDSSNWDSWYREFKTKAVAHILRDYIDEKRPWLPMPTEPDISTYETVVTPPEPAISAERETLFEIIT